MSDTHPKQVFGHDALTKCVLSGEALEQFKRDARMHVVNDHDTGYQARIYTKDDGSILIDSIGYGPR